MSIFFFQLLLLIGNIVFVVTSSPRDAVYLYGFLAHKCEQNFFTYILYVRISRILIKYRVYGKNKNRKYGQCVSAF